MFGYLSPSVRRDLFFTLFPRHASVLRSVCQSAPVSTNLIVPDSRSLHQKNSSCFSFIGGRFLSRHKERNPKPDGFGLLVEKFALRRVIEISALGELGSTTGGLQTVLLLLKSGNHCVAMVSNIQLKINSYLTHRNLWLQLYEKQH